MRICVVGCGAVGSLFAANLAQLDDVEVWAYDLAREHVDAINANGLRLSGAGEVVGRPRATADAIPGAELLLLRGMGHDLPKALWPRLVDAIAGVVARGEAVVARA